MGLSETPDVIDIPDMHYLFLEAKGPFQETARKVWGDFHKNFAAVLSNGINGTLSLYQVSPEMIYRAGASLKAEPTSIPSGFRYEKVKGGKYTRFSLTGSYAQLPEASGRVHAYIREKQLPLRPAYFIERYMNDPSKTPEAELLTEILVPTV
jgi:DNA gyrase inhibitor GyrI